MRGDVEEVGGRTILDALRWERVFVRGDVDPHDNGLGARAAREADGAPFRASR